MKVILILKFWTFSGFKFQPKKPTKIHMSNVQNNWHLFCVGMCFFAVYLCLAPAYLKYKSYKISFFSTSNADETLNINLTNYGLEFLTPNWVLNCM